jgi:hypothetical protein
MDLWPRKYWLKQARYVGEEDGVLERYISSNNVEAKDARVFRMSASKS